MISESSTFLQDILYHRVTRLDYATPAASTPFPIVAHPCGQGAGGRRELHIMSSTGYNQSFPYGGQQGGGELGAMEVSSSDGN